MWAILVAAGAGRRMGAQLPKQYLPLAGKPVIERSVRILEASQAVTGILVVLAESDRHWSALSLQCSKPLRTATGGAERADSVLAGLQALRRECADDDWVLVHDAARACLRPELIDRMESELMGHVCGGLMALPVRDTLKQAVAGEVQATVNRSALWQAQTPQIFRYQLLVDALIAARQQGVNVTDESMAMELAGHHPKLVEGRADNIKITVAEDIALAEYLLSKRGSPA